MTKLILAALAAASLSVVGVSAANAQSRHVGWGCQNCGFTNGTQLTGIADPASSDRDRLEWFGGCDDWGCGTNGRLSDGRAGEAELPAVSSIILPSGEAIEWR